MGITNSNKVLSTAQISCGETFKVTLSLTGEPDIVSHPTDIVLILDRSGSMAGSPMANLKSGAKKFIDIIDEATDSTQDGQIGNGSRIGIVSFAETATQDTQLITSVADLKAAVNSLSAGGNTNHADAFSEATQLIDSSTHDKVFVMFTDGRTTAGPDAAPFAAAAKAKGVIIYCIGLSGNGGIDEQALNAWASDPASSYVAITPNDEELEKLFEDLAKNISKPGATNIVINEKVDACFRIAGLSTPTKGTAALTGPTSLRWNIDKLGVSSSEGASLEFTVEHVGPCTGVRNVNEEITYTDTEGNKVSFPEPQIKVECGIDVIAEDCPTPVEIDADGCHDEIEFDAGDLDMQSLGRILQLDVTLRNVCPHRRVALGVILTELDAHGIEYKRGMKTVTIPAHQYSDCRNVTVRCIKFVLPEDLDVSGGSTTSICNQRRFKARFISHYVDTDFECCDVVF